MIVVAVKIPACLVFVHFETSQLRSLFIFY